MLIYYRFMGCFPIGLDFLFIIFLLHFFLSCGIFLVDHKFCHIGFYNSITMSFLVFQLAFCLQLQTPYISSPNHPHLSSSHVHTSLPPLITVMIGSNSNQFSQLFTCPSVFHLIICISALSNFNPISTSKGLVSLPKVMLLLTQLTYTRLQRGSSGCQKWKTPSELHPSISDSSCSSKICSISIKSVSQITKTLYTSICLSFHHQVLT